MNRPSEAALLRARGYNDETGICFCVSDTQRCQSCLELGAVLDKFAAQARLEQCKTVEQMFDDGLSTEEIKRYLDKRIATPQQQAGENDGK